MFIYIVTFLLLTCASCNKVKEKDVQVSKDYAMIHHSLSYFLPLVIHTCQSRDYLIETINNGKDTLNSCANYSLVSGDTALFENVNFEINFHQCLDLDQFNKNGSLLCEVGDCFDVDSAMCIVQFSGLSLGGSLLSGDFLVTRISAGEYEVSSSNAKIDIGTRNIRYSGVFNYGISSGMSSSLLSDNEIIMNDSLSTITDRYGNIGLVISENVKRAMSCSWYSSGLSVIEDSSDDSQIINYGDGTCDDQVVTTFAGVDVNFGL